MLKQFSFTWISFDKIFEQLHTIEKALGKVRWSCKTQWMFSDVSLNMFLTKFHDESRMQNKGYQHQRLPDSQTNVRICQAEERIQPVGLGEEGDFSKIFQLILITGSLLSERWSILHNTAVTKQWTANKLISQIQFSELYKIMVKKVTFAGSRGGIAPIALLLDPSLVRHSLVKCAVVLVGFDELHHLSVAITKLHVLITLHTITLKV